MTSSELAQLPRALRAAHLEAPATAPPPPTAVLGRVGPAAPPAAPPAVPPTTALECECHAVVVQLDVLPDGRVLFSTANEPGTACGWLCLSSVSFPLATALEQVFAPESAVAGKGAVPGKSAVTAGARPPPPTCMQPSLRLNDGGDLRTCSGLLLLDDAAALTAAASATAAFAPTAAASVSAAASEPDGATPPAAPSAIAARPNVGHNSEGAPVRLGGIRHDGAESAVLSYYCGRTYLVDGKPETCGPEGGPPCASCSKFTPAWALGRLPPAAAPTAPLTLLGGLVAIGSIASSAELAESAISAARAAYCGVATAVGVASEHASAQVRLLTSARDCSRLIEMAS